MPFFILAMDHEHLEGRAVQVGAECRARTLPVRAAFGAPGAVGTARPGTTLIRLCPAQVPSLPVGECAFRQRSNASSLAPNWGGSSCQGSMQGHTAGICMHFD